jgi:hypothetical protein
MVSTKVITDNNAPSAGKDDDVKDWEDELISGI